MSFFCASDIPVFRQLIIPRVGSIFQSTVTYECIPSQTQLSSIDSDSTRRISYQQEHHNSAGTQLTHFICDFFPRTPCREGRRAQPKVSVSVSYYLTKNQSRSPILLCAFTRYSAVVVRVVRLPVSASSISATTAATTSATSPATTTSATVISGCSVVIRVVVPVSSVASASAAVAT